MKKIGIDKKIARYVARPTVNDYRVWCETNGTRIFRATRTLVYLDADLAEKVIKLHCAPMILGPLVIP